MREFKDSGIEWIGKIPKEWKTCRFKNFMELRTEPSTSENKIGLENIESESGHFIQTEGKFDGNGVQFHEGEIVYGKLRPYLRKVWLASFDGNAVGDFFVFRNKRNSNANFLKWLLLSDGFTEAVNSSVYGAKMPRVSSDFILTLPYCIPPLSEQQRIADYLDKKCGEIDELIALQEQMIAQLTDYKQSVITEAVTKGLNPEAELVPSGIDYIGEIPKNWNGCAPLKRFTEIILGKMLQSNASNDDTLEQYICAKDVHFDGIDYSDLKSMYFSNYEKKQYKVHKGDMLVVEGGAGAAGSAIVERDIHNVFIQNSIMIVRPLNDFCIKYARYVLFSIVSRGYVDYICNKATIPHFTKEKLSGTIIPIPPISEQHAIATYLDTKCSEIDSLIAIKQQKIETLKDYKKSVIYEAVTGKMIV